MISIHLVMAAIASAGFIAALTVHLYAWMQIVPPIGKAVWLLHVGIFIPFSLLVFSANATTPHPKKRGNLEHLFQELPPWARRLSYGIFIYALANFALFMFQTSHYPKHHVPEWLALRGFSGHWLLFYGISIAGHIGLFLFKRRWSGRERPGKPSA